MTKYQKGDTFTHPTLGPVRVTSTQPDRCMVVKVKHPAFFDGLQVQYPVSSDDMEAQS